MKANTLRAPSPASVSSQYLSPSGVWRARDTRPIPQDPESVLLRCTERLTQHHGRAVVQTALRKVSSIFDEMQKENDRIHARHTK
jgi:hypothetical protein